MFFSASNLVKQSASQSLFFELKKLERQVTPRIIEGNKHAEEVVKLNEASAERRGIYSFGEDVIFFTIDMVKENVFSEIKNVQGEYKQWYLEYSLLQAIFYATLLEKVSVLDTPKFMRKKGYQQELTVVPEEKEFHLLFGNETFRVQPCEELLDFYVNKSQVIKKGVETKNYNECRLFDAHYKFKEFQKFKDVIQFKKLS